MICIDSTFLIDILRNKKEALEKMEELENEELAISSVSFFEVMLGINLMKNKKEERSEQFTEITNNLETFDLDVHAARIASKISSDLILSGKTIDQFDCLIAGTMLANHCNCILTNDDHFSRIKGLKVESY